MAAYPLLLIRYYLLMLSIIIDPLVLMLCIIIDPLLLMLFIINVPLILLMIKYPILMIRDPLELMRAILFMHTEK